MSENDIAEGRWEAVSERLFPRITILDVDVDFCVPWDFVLEIYDILPKKFPQQNVFPFYNESWKLINANRYWFDFYHNSRDNTRYYLPLAILSAITYEYINYGDDKSREGSVLSGIRYYYVKTKIKIEFYELGDYTVAVSYPLAESR